MQVKREDERSGLTTKVLPGNPHPGEAEAPAERDLALRGANLGRADALDRGSDCLEQRPRLRFSAGEEVVERDGFASARNYCSLPACSTPRLVLPHRVSLVSTLPRLCRRSWG